MNVHGGGVKSGDKCSTYHNTKNFFLPYFIIWREKEKLFNQINHIIECILLKIVSYTVEAYNDIGLVTVHGGDFCR